ncbi:hypothetical protein LG943_04940 [Streptomonospora sp. S1-112]|uniref:TrbC/VIRB2 family protein n=1 Tax=Streptomonospora mangrovi TaxID=2883123 RepID=A0A9X3NIH8_9ACTN|nr:hypothetical protein [Streptomonospora mangrovi]MDA0563680.1 hypothetical protein [Streptomonospora mangrovi]
MDGLLYLAGGLVDHLALVPMSFNWSNNPELPDFNGSTNPIEQVINWGQGIIVVIGIIGILFAAGKMAIGKFGRSDLAADGVGGLVWTVMGISLMLVAIPVIRTVASVA